MNRRHFLTITAAAGGSVPLRISARSENRKKLGLTIWSYNVRWGRRNREEAPASTWKSALDVLDKCAELGAGCLQIGVRGWTDDFAGKVRDHRENLGVELEGQIGLPREPGDLDRFEAELIAAKEAGARVLRTVCLGGRRYETFESLDDWKEFVADSTRALESVEPVLGKHRVRLAVENHKDWRFAEQLELLGHLESQWIGVNFDFGNNLALLEDPHRVAQALAPYLMTTHVKDMALAEYGDGFLLSEVPLGEGVLDLRTMMDVCEAKQPGVHFNLEMITRDPLQVPVLKEEYWATMPGVPGSELAFSVALARKGDTSGLPRTEGLNDADLVALEEKQIRQSFDYAREELGLI